jgi:hypothetical protein
MESRSLDPEIARKPSNPRQTAPHAEKEAEHEQDDPCYDEEVSRMPHGKSLYTTEHFRASRSLLCLPFSSITLPAGAIHDSPGERIMVGILKENLYDRFDLESCMVASMIAGRGASRRGHCMRENHAMEKA